MNGLLIYSEYHSLLPINYPWTHTCVDLPVALDTPNYYVAVENTLKYACFKTYYSLI